MPAFRILAGRRESPIATSYISRTLPIGSFHECPQTTRGFRLSKLLAKAPVTTMSPTESLFPIPATKHSTIPCAWSTFT